MNFFDPDCDVYGLAFNLIYTICKYCVWLGKIVTKSRCIMECD